MNKIHKKREAGNGTLITQSFFIAVAVLYYYFYKRTAIHLGDPRFYQDSVWLRKEFAHVRS
uniref:Uncharacterized protein n=1 Tax=Laticauda laticaudata TaxID=8630 RepID=A0A8C5RZ33_LATLA